MRKILTPALAALALIATPAVAEPQAFELHISHADLDLTSKSDVEILRKRIVDKVREACAHPAAPTQEVLYDRTCLLSTTRAAMAQVDAKRAAKIELASL